MEPLNIKIDNMEKIDLMEEYNKALLDPVFAKLAKKLKIKDEELANYTSMIETSASEYHNCMECKDLASCSNRIKGHVYMPINIEGNISFEYKPCKYYNKMKKNTKFLNNITYFNTPKELQEASLSKIFKNDKNRFDTILWVNKFYNEYKDDNHKKGLYLNGNFGCGKTYMIGALFNDLAHDGYESAIVFWPEFLRQAFYDDFKNKYEQIKKVPLLLIDDIGAENLTAWNRDEILCPLLQYRMEEELPTFFTSNLTIEQLEEHLSNSKTGVDKVKAARIIARINQLTESIEMVSKNLRK